MKSSITIVTPSFNQGKYLEATIKSVINQNYSSFEYFVLDAGSSDNTLQIIKKYESFFEKWRSEKDDGQASAINEGFNLANGDILGWLNSDDFYLPEIFQHVVDLLDIEKPQILIGNGISFFENKEICWASAVCAESKLYSLNLYDYIIQPSTFWTRKAWDLAGPLNTKYNYAFDWEWFIRAKKAGVEFIYTNKYLSCYRYHDQHKSSTSGNKRFNELIDVITFHTGSEYKYVALAIKKIIDSKFYKSRSFRYYKKLVRYNPKIYLGLLNPTLMKYSSKDLLSIEKMLL